MDYSTLESKLVAYLQKNGVDDLTLETDENLVLDAINEARLKAQHAHAFEMNKRTVRFPSVVTSVSWLTAADAEDSEITYNIRNLKKIWVGEGMVEAEIEYRSLINFEDYTKLKAAIVGPKLTIYPQSPDAVLVTADAYVWMEPLEGEEESGDDWMLDYGHNYLFWGALFILNHKVKEFVPRQEGNLGLSDNFVSQQLGGLIAWDNQLKNGGFNQL